jgi:sterol desaturase/sphingolipid hydroxylase (fatty acid hydroxylase superfamily)
MLWHHPFWVAYLAGLFALVESSLSEYWIHRLMHTRGLVRRRHMRHHKAGEGQGWAGEFRDYMLPALPFCALSFVPSFAIGEGFSAGVTLYWAFSAYAHQVQHERPELVFWMRAPVHHLHHRHEMLRHNYGIGVDVWDRVFGTYLERSWPAGPRPRGLGAWLRIRWF